MSLLEVYCHVDDFWQGFADEWERSLLESGQRRRDGQLSISEIMIYFHQMRYRDFKTYYTQFVQVYLRSEFPKLVSYSRFVEVIPSVLCRCVPICKAAIMINLVAGLIAYSHQPQETVFSGWGG